jgi:hypothetical protein
MLENILFKISDKECDSNLLISVSASSNSFSISAKSSYETDEFSSAVAIAEEVKAASWAIFADVFYV